MAEKRKSICFYNQQIVICGLVSLHCPPHPTPKKGQLIFLGLAVSEMELFMSDNKVIQKFSSRIPGIGNTDKVETTLQFLQGAHYYCFLVLGRFSFSSLSCCTWCKDEWTHNVPSPKERERKGISRPGEALCQEDLMGSPKHSHDVYSVLEF